MKNSILVVDDDPGMSKFICTSLEEAGYKAHRAKDVSGGLAKLKNEKIDLLILDIELPGLSGLQMLELLKKDAATAKLPVIMLTVKNEEAFKLKGLKGGADDYLTKPFSPKELVARIEAILRRSRPVAHDQVLQAAGLRLDLARREASYKGKSIDLRPAEFDLLAALVRHAGKVLSHKDAGAALPSGEIKPEGLHTHVKNIRTKVGNADLIETVHGLGYRLSDK